MGCHRRLNAGSAKANREEALSANGKPTNDPDSLGTIRSGFRPGGFMASR